MSKRSSASFERPLQDGDKLVVTIESDETTFIAPSGWTLSTDDIIETRHLSQSQSMRFPADVDTTRRLDNVIHSEPVKWVIDGKERLGWFRRLIRWLKGK